MPRFEGWDDLRKEGDSGLNIGDGHLWPHDTKPVSDD